MKIECAHDKIVSIKDLKPNPKNRNQHTLQQVKLLAKIMKHQGVRNPIVVSNQSGFMTKGHGRLLAAQENKWKEMPVDFQDYKSEADEYADMVADNKIAELAETDLSMVLQDVLDLGPDFDFDLLGIPDFKLPEDFEPGCDEDSIPEHVEPKTKLGDLYQLGEHRLLCGDSTSIDAVEKLMDGEMADLCLTDPPYGIGLKYRTHDDSESKWFYLIDLVVPIARGFSSFVIMPCCRIKALDYWYKNHKPDWIMCWYKGSPGHRSQIGFNDWEPHLTWGKPKRQMHDFFQTKCGFEIEGHPCPKPVEYAETLINMALDTKSLILDLFGGSGTTMIAAAKTHHKCFMMELDPHYCDVIVARWEKYTGKKATLNGQTA